MAGYAGIDDGYARFNRVRIPRWHMLSKFANVTKDGQWPSAPNHRMPKSTEESVLKCYTIDHPLRVF